MIILKKSSEPSFDYNCIAWAAEEDAKWLDPAPYRDWPAGVTREPTIEALVSLYENLGYEVCDSENVEPGYMKVAIYANSIGMPKHASRQLPSGEWTSKLGTDIDVTHEFIRTWGSAVVEMRPINLSGYGQLVKILKKTC